MRTIIRSLLLSFLIVISAACTPQAAPTSAPAQTPAALTTLPASAPTVAPPLAPVTAPAARDTTLTVLAAASLTESFTEIGKLFEASHPGVKIAFSFAGSQALAQQLSHGAPADVFASASSKYMDAAVDAKRVNKADVLSFALNKLTVIYPTANPAGLNTLQDLARPGVKLVLADKSVPVGQYSLTFFENASMDQSFGPVYKDNVLKNVVSYEENVKSVLAKVSLGEADAGIVYTTDITQAAKGKVVQITIPDALNVIAAYPIAPIGDSANPGLAKAFVDLVMGPDGQEVLARYGFIPPG